MARQPILNAQGKVWGYELLFKDSKDALCAMVRNQESATITVATSGFLRACEDIAHDNEKIFINFLDSLILEEAPKALPPGSTVIEVLENCDPTDELHAALLDLKFDLFQGYFFAKPEMVEGRKLSSHQQSRIHLLNELNTAGDDIQKMAEIIRNDVALSYRLLRFVNSAAFSLRSEVNTIEHAISLIGIRMFTHWARLIILSDLIETATSMELCCMSITRANFFNSW